MSEETYSALWPRGEKTVEIAPLAPRLDTLEGKTVAFMWDYLFRGDEIFPILRPSFQPPIPT